jgi:uncharacterized Zn finger protein (UPF0148 family)
MTTYPTRPCPRCGQPLTKKSGGAYKCTNEECSVHRVYYDRIGKVYEVIYSSQPEAKYLSTLQRLRGEGLT